MLDLIRRHDGHTEALVDAECGQRVSYAELAARAGRAAEELAGLQGRAMVFLLAASTVDFVALYLGCLAARLPVLLVDPDAAMGKLLEAYRPSMILCADDRAFEGYGSRALATAPSYRAWRRPGAYAVHPDAALFLSTSGSTGSPKLVRLTEGNLRSNALSIAEYLELGPGERAVQSLKLHYSYGLSVLNSHLAGGGTVVLTPRSFIRPEFWQALDGERCTSFAGVPYMYETLHRLRFKPARHPSLRTLTQAGGGLAPDLAAHFHHLAVQAGARLVVMYGQTEATARIAYVPPPRLLEKLGAIGIAIPGGTLSLRPVAGMAGQELVYAGPNVMLGYAECAADLALGDVLGGVLGTGDLAVRDDDGFFRLVGRLNRFAKLFGMRIGLEEVERSVEAAFKVPAGVVEGKDELHVLLESPGIDPAEVAAFLARDLGVPPKAIVARRVEALPRTGNGKKNYAAMTVPPC